MCPVLSSIEPAGGSDHRRLSWRSLVWDVCGGPNPVNEGHYRYSGRVLADPRERCRSDLLVVMEGEREVRPTGTLQPFGETQPASSATSRSGEAQRIRASLSLLAKRSRGKQHSEGLGDLFTGVDHVREHLKCDRLHLSDRLIIVGAIAITPGSSGTTARIRPSCSRPTSMRIGWMLTLFFTPEGRAVAALLCCGSATSPRSLTATLFPKPCNLSQSEAVRRTAGSSYCTGTLTVRPGMKPAIS